MSDIDRYSAAGEEQVAQFLRRIALDFNKRCNPVFEGHRTTYPGQQRIGFSQSIGFGFMYSSPAAVYSVAAHQLLTTAGKNVGIEPSPHGSYHLAGGDQVYYPFKGVVDYIFK